MNKDLVKPTVDATTKGAQTGIIGDRKIFLFYLPECIRIRTEEIGTCGDWLIGGAISLGTVEEMWQ